MTEKLYGLDLFSGIGGISIALAPWVTPIAYCEIDPFAQAVLLSRMRDGGLSPAPIWDDVRTLSAAVLPGHGVDIIYGGFPCQDLSLAGARAGLDGKRSGLFFEIVRLVDELQPAFIFLENVPGIRQHAHGVFAELAKRGFDARWCHLSAADVGAPHRRERWWCLASHPDRIDLRKLAERHQQHAAECGDAEPRDDGPQESVADSDGQERRSETGDADGGSSRETLCEGEAELGGRSSHRIEVADTAGSGQPSGRLDFSERRSETVVGRVALGNADSEGQPQQEGLISEQRRWPFDAGWWSAEPDMGRVANGVPNRVDRLRGLGNAVVPKTAREAFKALAGLNQQPGGPTE